MFRGLEPKPHGFQKLSLDHNTDISHRMVQERLYPVGFTSPEREGAWHRAYSCDRSLWT